MYEHLVFGSRDKRNSLCLWHLSLILCSGVMRYQKIPLASTPLINSKIPLIFRISALLVMLGGACSLGSATFHFEFEIIVLNERV
jgi:hypothetical protein